MALDIAGATAENIGYTSSGHPSPKATRSTVFQVTSQHIRNSAVSDEHGRSWSFDATGVASVDVHAALYFVRLGKLGYTVAPPPPDPETVPPFVPVVRTLVDDFRPQTQDLIDVAVAVGSEARAKRFPLTVFDPAGLAVAIRADFSKADISALVSKLGGVVETGLRPTPEHLSNRILDDFTAAEVAEIVTRLGGARPVAAPISIEDAIDEASQPEAAPVLPPAPAMAVEAPNPPLEQPTATPEAKNKKR